MEEDGASLNIQFSSSAGSESSPAPLTLPDGFNWSPLARSRAQESLYPLMEWAATRVITLIRWSVYMFTQADAHRRVCARSPVCTHIYSYTHVQSKHLIHLGTPPTRSISLLSAFRHKSTCLKTCHKNRILCEYTFTSHTMLERWVAPSRNWLFDFYLLERSVQGFAIYPRMG